jgi:hypothetical protein
LGVTVFTDKPLLTASLIPFALRFLERFARVSVLPARPPVTTARRRSCLSKIRKSSLGRRPDFPALEPLQFGVRMALLQSAESRQQIFSIRSTKRSR